MMGRRGGRTNTTRSGGSVHPGPTRAAPALQQTVSRHVLASRATGRGSGVASGRLTEQFSSQRDNVQRHGLRVPRAAGGSSARPRRETTPIPQIDVQLFRCLRKSNRVAYPDNGRA